MTSDMGVNGPLFEAANGALAMTALWAFIVLASAVVVTSFATPSGLTVRRMAVAIVFLIVGTLTAWILNTGRFERQRILVIAYDCRALSPAALNDQIARHGQSASKIRLLAVATPDSGESSESGCDGGQLERLRRGPVDRVERFEIASDDGEADPFSAFLERAVDLAGMWNWGSIADLFLGQPTLLLVFDETSVLWRESLRIAENKAMGTWLALADRGQLEIFGVDLGDPETASALGMDLRWDYLRTGDLSKQYTRVDFTLRTSQAEEAERLKVELCVRIGAHLRSRDCRWTGRARKDLITIKTRTFDRAGPGLYREMIPIGDLASAGPGGERAEGWRQSEEGWHRIEVYARVQGRILPKVTAFFPLRKEVATIVFDGSSLHDQSWPVPGIAPAKVLWERTGTGIVSQRRVRYRRRPSACEFDWSAGGPTRDAEIQLNECLNRSDGLVLVEPGQGLIGTLDRLGLQDKIRDGLSVLVAAPQDALRPTSWLPVRTKGIIDARRRIYFVGDCSRYQVFPRADGGAEAILDKGAPTPEDTQEAIPGLVADLLYKRLRQRHGSRTPTGAPAREGGFFVLGHRSDWVSPLFIQARAPCLQANPARMRSAGQAKAEDPMGLLPFLASSQLDVQLEAFLGWHARSEPNPSADRSGTLYPGTTLVVLTAGAPQFTRPYAHGYALDFQGRPLASGGRTLGQTLDVLHKARMNLIVATLPTDPVTLRTVERNLDAGRRSTLMPATRPWPEVSDQVVRRGFTVLPSRNVRPPATAEEIARALTTVLEAAVMNGPPVLARDSLGRLAGPPGGRLFDPRTSPTSLAPGFLRRFESVDQGTSVKAALFAPRLAPAGEPVFVDRPLGAGRVSVLSYTPFAFGPWLSGLAPALSRGTRPVTLVCRNVAGRNINDCLPSWLVEAFRKTGPEQVGWGPQRLLDYLDWVPTPGLQAGRLQAVSVSPDGEELRLSVGLPQRFHDNDRFTWTPPPQLVLPWSKEPQPLRLDGIDTVRRLARFSFSSENAPASLETVRARLVLNGFRQSGSNVTQEDIWLSLKPSQPGGETALQLLSTLITLNGGHVLTDPLPVRVDEVMPFATVLFLFTLMLLFSPIVRPWTAFALALRRRSQKRRGVEDALGFMPDFVEEALGHELNRVTAQRRAGDPAWTRPYEPGDSLSRALPGDLASLSAAASAQGIDPMRPRMRLREIEESFEVTLAIDVGPSLRVPRSDPEPLKLQLLKAIMAVSATAVSLRRGTWQLLALQQPDEISGPFRASKSDDVMADVDRLVAQVLGHTGPLEPLVPQLGPDQTVIIITDFLDAEEHDYMRIIEECGQSCHGVRVVGLFDSGQSWEIGAGSDARTGRAIDRSEWTVRDMAQAIEDRRQRLRTLIEDRQAPYLEARTDMFGEELVQAILDSGVFAPEDGQ